MQTEKKLTGYPSIDKPWLKYYSNDAINAILPELTMYEYIFNNNQDNLNRIALNYYGTNISYGKMFKQIALIAGGLERAGVKAGDIVTVAMINSPETIMLMFAINKIGAVANMLYGSSSAEELKKHIKAAKSTIVFTLDIFQDIFARIADQIRINTVVITNLTRSMPFANRFSARYIKGLKPKSLHNDSRFVDWDDFFSKSKESKNTFHDADAPAIIVYTGGTTGGSKGAVLSNRAIISVPFQYILQTPDLRRESTWIQLLPLFIAYGVTCSMMIPLAVGMTLIVRIPMSDSIAQLCKRFNPNYIIYGPAYWEALADDKLALELSYLIAPITGGDTLKSTTETKINQYLSKCGCRYPILNGYGMTEVGAAVSVNAKYAHKLGSVGIPFAKNIISAFDIETGKELKYGKKGEICIYSPSTMIEYINNIDETQNIIRKHVDGKFWVHSGDLGYVTEDGFVFITGRLKRYFLYIANGLQKKIFSFDIEKILLEHPKVDNCAIVPIADDITFQKPVAYIILNKEYISDQNIGNELKAYCEKNMPDGYKPVRFTFVGKFPLTKVGKIDYLLLEKMAESQDKGE